MAIGVAFVALACRAHVGTPASAAREDDAGGEVRWGLSGVDAGPPDPESAEAVDGDGDGIPDFKDKCPNEPETYNGVQDDDGCPDRSGGRGCGSGEFRITKALVLFDDNSAAIRPSTATVLDSIVDYLQCHPERRAEMTLEGHAEASERHPTALAAARAAAVRRYLVQHGVPSRAFKPARHEKNPARDMWGNEPDAPPTRRHVDLRILGG